MNVELTDDELDLIKAAIRMACERASNDEWDTAQDDLDAWAALYKRLSGGKTWFRDY